MYIDDYNNYVCKWFTKRGLVYVLAICIQLCKFEEA